MKGLYLVTLAVLIVLGPVLMLTAIDAGDDYAKRRYILGAVLSILGTTLFVMSL